MASKLNCRCDLDMSDGEGRNARGKLRSEGMPHVCLKEGGRAATCVNPFISSSHLPSLYVSCHN